MFCKMQDESANNHNLSKIKKLVTYKDQRYAVSCREIPLLVVKSLQVPDYGRLVSFLDSVIVHQQNMRKKVAYLSKLIKKRHFYLTEQKQFNQHQKAHKLVLR